MQRFTKDNHTKKRTPLYVFVCEGINKTERTFLNHFVERDNPYKIKIENSSATDIQSMADKALHLYKEYQMDDIIGDHMFCLIDIDLNKDKGEKYYKIKNDEKYSNISLIPSNPCFEVWYMYYFVDNPKVKSSSQKVKEEMRKFIKDYTESTDVIAIGNFDLYHAVAINRSEKKNNNYDANTPIHDRNPYTEIQDIVLLLLTKKQK